MKDMRDRIVTLQVNSIRRTSMAANTVVVPVVDASGLEVEICLPLEAAHHLLADMKMTLLSSALGKEPQLITMPKAPVTLDVHSWSAGWCDRKCSVILRLEGEGGEMVDANFPKNSLGKLVEYMMAHEHLCPGSQSTAPSQ